MPQRTAVFSKLVRDSHIESPLVVSPGTSLLDVIGKITDTKATCVIITDDQNYPLGILTEQDITRRITFRIPGNEPIENVMSAPVISVRDDEYLYYAIARINYDINYGAKPIITRNFEP